MDACGRRKEEKKGGPLHYKRVNGCIVVLATRAYQGLLLIVCHVILLLLPLLCTTTTTINATSHFIRACRPECAWVVAECFVYGFPLAWAVVTHGVACAYVARQWRKKKRIKPVDDVKCVASCVCFLYYYYLCSAASSFALS